MPLCNETKLECMYDTNKLKMHLKRGANIKKNYLKEIKTGQNIPWFQKCMWIMFKIYQFYAHTT